MIGNIRQQHTGEPRTEVMMRAAPDSISGGADSGMAQTGSDQEAVEYVNFKPRLYASMIDMILSSLVLSPIAYFLKQFIFDDVIPSVALQQKIQSTLEFCTNSGFSDECLQKAVDLSMSLTYEQGPKEMISLVLMIAAVFIFWSCKDATPGKMLLRMRIQDADTGLSPTRLQYVIRFLGYIVSTIPLGLGFFYMVFDKRKQCLHDKLAGTVVVKVRKKKKA